MIPSWVNHFGKITDWSLKYFLIYVYLNILASRKFSFLVSIYYQPIIQKFLEKTLEMDQKQAQLDLLYFCISAKNHQGTHAQAMDGHISSFKGFYGLELLNVVYKVLKEDAARAKGFKG